MYRYLKVYQGSVNKRTSFTILTIYIIYVTFVHWTLDSYTRYTVHLRIQASKVAKIHGPLHGNLHSSLQLSVPSVAPLGVGGICIS